MTIDFNDLRSFVAGMFDPAVRDPDRVVAQIRDANHRGDLYVAFTPDSEALLDTWVAAWQSAAGDPYDAADLAHCPARDRAALAFLAGYVAGNRLGLVLPRASYRGDAPDGVPIYAVPGYERVALRGGDGRTDAAAVRRFLRLFLFGAHFVVVQNPRDLPPGVVVQDLVHAFAAGPLAGDLRRDPGNSHYRHLAPVNLNGRYYPDGGLPGRVPDPTPFMLSWLVCPTVADLAPDPADYSAFFQLEGWQAVDARHDADFKTSQRTLWNISTYGASAYSEKRATTAFLAPDAWTPRVGGDTLMAPYAGAETRQPWLRAEYVAT
jgi:hypothetical protein